MPVRNVICREWAGFRADLRQKPAQMRHAAMSVHHAFTNSTETYQRARPTLVKLGRATLSTLPILGIFGEGILAYHLFPEFEFRVDAAREWLALHSPYSFETLASASVLTTSNFFTQRFEGGRLSYSRLAKWFIFGSVVGFSGRRLYNFLDQMYPIELGKQIANRIAVDQGTYSPIFLLFIISYFRRFPEPSAPTSASHLNDKPKSFRQQYFTTLPFNWAYWSLACLVIYNMPLDLQVYTGAVFGFTWGIFLSRFMSNGHQNNA